MRDIDLLFETIEKRLTKLEKMCEKMNGWIEWMKAEEKTKR